MTNIDVSNDVLPVTYLSSDNTEYIGDQYFIYQILFDREELSEQDRNGATGSAMVEYGGCFIKALGQTLLYADSVNTRKIKEAFPREWNEYAALAGIEA